MTAPRSGSRSRSAPDDPASANKSALARLLAEALLADDQQSAGPPIFFQGEDGALIWANFGYYRLAQELSPFPEAQKLLHPTMEPSPAGRLRASWSQDARAVIDGRPAIVRAWYCRAGRAARGGEVLVGLLQVAGDDAELGHRMMRIQERFDDIVRLVSDWIWETDAAMVVTFASDRVMHAAGYTPHALIGRPLTDLAYDAASAQRLRDRLMGLTPFRDLTFSLRDQAGSEKNYLFSAVPIFDPIDGAHLGFRGTAFDITGLTERERAILAAKEAAEQANRAKSRFLANMSHELRTPLNAMIGFSDILRREGNDRPSPSDITGFANEINASARQLLGIINDILDIARIEAGRFDLREEETTPELLCQGAVALVKEQADQHGIRLLVELGRNLPNLRVDTRVLRQVLVNLLANAIKFTEAGGEIALRCQMTIDGEVLLQVCDSGIGMSEVDLKRVLEPFVQAETDNSRRYSGAGLGLSLSKRLVELHGGRLGIVSRPNMGTTVSVHLPKDRAG